MDASLISFFTGLRFDGGHELLKKKMCGLSKYEQGFEADNCDHLAHANTHAHSLPHKCVDRRVRSHT